MSEFPRPIPVPRKPSESENRLDSWKEIAAYLGREVRTVQGWEKNEGLPIHRHQHARQGSVYAFKSELDAWRQKRAAAPEAEPAAGLADSEPRRRVLAIVSAVAVVAVASLGIYWWRVRVAAPP